MRMYDMIEEKKRGGELSREQIYAMINRYTDGEIPDYQMSAFLMAVYFRGMSEREMLDLTCAMAHSGDTVDLSEFGSLTVDKHSTGGVGDKTTLIVAPIAAAAGAVVAKMSGRGLGHTGGTVDKLESIPGYRSSLTSTEFSEQVKKIGIAVVGQSGSLATADKKLYALRDVTATVDSIPLIASSIMSKKLAAGTSSIVLDVKCGNGAFMRTPDEAEALASAMVKIGRAHGRGMSALITDMNTPLGYAVGNALEVKEAIEVLKGRGSEDLRAVSLELAALMIKNALGIKPADARKRASELLTSGAAYKTFLDWIGAQGADVSYAECPEKFGEAKYKREIKAGGEGYLVISSAECIGRAAMVLGAGRKTADDKIDPLAGIVLSKRNGEPVAVGDTLATLYTERECELDEAEKIFVSAISIEKACPARGELIYRVIE